MGEVSITARLTTIDCAHCGILFGITSDFQDRRREDSKSFYCPAGHSNVYKDSEVDRLRRQLAQRDQRIASLQENVRIERVNTQTAKRKATIAIKEKNNLEVRVKSGVCPYCKRTFQQLVRHMHSKHPKEVH